MRKTIIKFIVVAILIFGVYYGSQVTPVEEKRVDATLENVSNLEAVSFNLEGSIEDAREGFYDLQIRDGYIGESSGEGEFLLETRIEGESQRMTGEFVYSDPDFYLNFDEEGLPIVLEGFFRDNFNQNIEEVRNNWIRIAFDLDTPPFSLVEESVEVINDEEEVDEMEMYHYGFDLQVDGVIAEPMTAEMFTGKEDLNLYRFLTDTEIELDRDLEALEPFGSFFAGASPTLKIEVEFSDFDELKDVEIPEEYLDL